MLEVGKKAPAFQAEATGGQTLGLKDFRGQTLVLYFYPKDDTPGCTKEACAFRDDSAKLKRAGAAVVGVSPDGVARHEKFRDKYGLRFALLADEDHAICEAYGVWKLKKNYGREYMGVERTTVLIDGKGRIARVFPKVKVDGHAAEVLAAVKALGA